MMNEQKIAIQNFQTNLHPDLDDSLAYPRIYTRLDPGDH